MTAAAVSEKSRARKLAAAGKSCSSGSSSQCSSRDGFVFFATDAVSHVAATPPGRAGSPLQEAREPALHRLGHRRQVGTQAVVAAHLDHRPTFAGGRDAEP